MGVLNRPRPALSYLADSSYWVYLTHLPIVGLLQVDLHTFHCTRGLKFLIVLSITMGLTLASYQVAVRYTVVGFWLHGKRDRTRFSLPSRRHFSSAWPSNPPLRVGRRVESIVSFPIRIIARRTFAVRAERHVIVEYKYELF